MMQTLSRKHRHWNWSLRILKMTRWWTYDLSSSKTLLVLWYVVERESIVMRVRNSSLANNSCLSSTIKKTRRLRNFNSSSLLGKTLEWMKTKSGSCADSSLSWQLPHWSHQHEQFDQEWRWVGIYSDIIETHIMNDGITEYIGWKTSLCWCLWLELNGRKTNRGNTRENA